MLDLTTRLLAFGTKKECGCPRFGPCKSTKSTLVNRDSRDHVLAAVDCGVYPIVKRTGRLRFVANQSVYIETSVVSYLASRPSRDPVVAGHQVATHDWWNVRRSRYGLYVSELVIAEASRGDQQAAIARLALIDGIELLQITDEVAAFAQSLIDLHAIPAMAGADAVHVAVAAVNGMHYLLTWNCKHIANAERRDAISAICLRSGYKPPVICTPDELAGD